MITIEAAVLAGAMKHAASVVEASTIIPILANVMLATRDGALEITTNDLDCQFRQRLSLVECEEGLTTTVDARRLSALANAVAKGARLTLALSEGRLIVKSGRSRWQLPTLPATDFPVIPEDDMPGRIALGGADLAQALVRVQWSISTDQARYYLCGALLHAEAGKAALASTNGNTLMQVVLESDLEEGAPDTILSAKFTRLLAGLCAAAPDVTLAWGVKLARATIGDAQLTAKNIDGSFPDYRRVIPPSDVEPTVFDPASLRGAVRRVQLIATEKTRAVKIDREADKLSLSVTSPEGGTACEEVPAAGVAGPTTGFNTRFLEQMVEAIGGDSIAMHQAEAGAPARFERVVRDGALCVVMPMRV